MSDTAVQEHHTAGRTAPLFSLPSFLHGLAAAATVLALMMIWMMIREDDTLTRIQDNLPSKTAIIDRVILEPPSADQSAETHNETSQAEQAPINENALPAAPMEGLFEERPEGRVPIANMQTGQTPFEAYRKPAALIPGRPAIALVFVDAGLSKNLTERIINELPENVTLAVSPYAGNVGKWMDDIRANGHEVWMTLPLQNDNYPDPDPGPQSILRDASIEQNQSRIMTLMASGAGYAGFVSLKDHSITEHSTNVEPVMRQIFGRGLAFVDGRNDRPFFAEALAKENGYPYAQVNNWIGYDMSPENIKTSLGYVERFAQAGGEAIIFIRTNRANIETVAEWTKTLESRGLQLAPLSATVTQ